MMAFMLLYGDHYSCATESNLSIEVRMLSPISRDTLSFDGRRSHSTDSPITFRI